MLPAQGGDTAKGGTASPTRSSHEAFPPFLYAHDPPAPQHLEGYRMDVLPGYEQPPMPVLQPIPTVWQSLQPQGTDGQPLLARLPQPCEEASASPAPENSRPPETDGFVCAGRPGVVGTQASRVATAASWLFGDSDDSAAGAGGRALGGGKFHAAAAAARPARPQAASFRRPAAVNPAHGFKRPRPHDATSGAHQPPSYRAGRGAAESSRDGRDPNGVVTAAHSAPSATAAGVDVGAAATQGTTVAVPPAPPAPVLQPHMLLPQPPQAAHGDVETVWEDDAFLDAVAAAEQRYYAAQ